MNPIQSIRLKWQYRKPMQAALNAATECACCRTKKGWLRFVGWFTVHHIVPVHVDPGQACDPNNMVCLCRFCHWVIAHGRDWKQWDPKLLETIAALRRILAGRLMQK